MRAVSEVSQQRGESHTGQPLIAVKGLQPEHGIPVIDVETGKASGIEADNLTFFTSWRIVTKVLDKYETVCSFPS